MQDFYFFPILSKPWNRQPILTKASPLEFSPKFPARLAKNSRQSTQRDGGFFLHFFDNLLRK